MDFLQVVREAFSAEVTFTPLLRLNGEAQKRLASDRREERRHGIGHTLMSQGRRELVSAF